MLLFGPEERDNDNYGLVVELADTIEQSGDCQPQNANQMIDGNGDVVNYSEDSSNIIKK